MAEERIHLAKLLDSISKEIRAIHERVKNDAPVMQFTECELEFAIEAEDQGEAGVNVWVVKLGGGLKRTESNTIRIKYEALSDVKLVAAVEAPPGTLPKIVRQRKSKVK